MNPIVGLVCVVLAIASPYFFFWIYSVRKRYKRNLNFLSALNNSAGLTDEINLESARRRAMEAAVDGIEWEIPG